MYTPANNPHKCIHVHTHSDALFSVPWVLKAPTYRMHKIIKYSSFLRFKKTLTHTISLSQTCKYRKVSLSLLLGSCTTHTHTL